MGDAAYRQPQVILEGVFCDCFARLNPHLPAEYVEGVLSKLKQTRSLDLVEANREIYRFWADGVPVFYRKEECKVEDRAFLLDFANAKRNAFWAVNHFDVLGKDRRRPDIVCFINGLPMAILELKNPADEKMNIWAEFHQLQKYKERLFELLKFNQALGLAMGRWRVWDANRR